MPPEGSPSHMCSELLGKSSNHREAIGALVARKREILKQQQHQRRSCDQILTEKYSGLRITNRCMRLEKWDGCMRGKEIVHFSNLGLLTGSRRDQVVIGVLCATPSKPALSPTGERIVEWTLTDLREDNAQVSAVLLAGDAMRHWGDMEGAGQHHATVGSIFGVLNPTCARGNRAMRVTVETQLIKLGTCPSLA
eukprot:CAMPEP_0168414962 /NCGR_PEP_ID=MMETSP0228-20121227/29993_1 /TAXON_ID=133427 /ORGANISM="Protoceratium reticulatum, Strain CCCM 535 (=CCMP 1889)" /LENGTH=193 /DNA_ID=CAMNT_0008428769 /DNA_START=108 /DNA_END=685 /DNA_ORIENTATION=-